MVQIVVSDMTISICFLRILSSDGYIQNNLPLFWCLSKLNLSSVFNKRQLLGIARLLQYAPNLESLKLEIILFFSSFFLLQLPSTISWIIYITLLLTRLFPHFA